MSDHFAFGGGASESSMAPAVLALTLVAVVALVLLHRRYSAATLLVPAFLVPVGQQLLIAGFHMFATRLIIIAGLARGLASLKQRSQTPLEVVFLLWAFFRGATFILLYRETGAIVAQIAFWLDAYGGFLLLRYAIQDRDDVERTLKVLSVIAAILAICMAYEYVTRVNVFSYLSGHSIVPWIRDGRVRAQGTFANSITAGTFGATLFPLFFWQWKSNSAKLSGALGMFAASAIALTSMASTSVTAYFGSILALCLWPLRKHMRSFRWGIVAAVIGLAVLMKAPVWYLLARVDFVGGHGWDRAFLVDQTVRHASDWWLLGSKDNSNWGADTWDACNQFVAEATGGGLISLMLIIVILSRGFGMIGKARKAVEGDCPKEWLYWCFGSALFAHIISFCGIDYFDNIRILWFTFLAMISVITAASNSTKDRLHGEIDPAGAWFLKIKLLAPV